MKAVLLIRVSTEGQEYDSQSKELEEYARSKGFDELYLIENKESGRKLTEEERQGLNEMKAYLTANQDCKDVFLWELSRLARKEKILHSIKDWLIDRGINLHIQIENLTLLNEDGSVNSSASLLFSLYGHLISEEMDIKIERMSRGRKANGEKGKWIGGRMRYGYDVDANGYLIAHKEKGKQVKLLFELYSTGKYSLNTVSDEMIARGYTYFSRIVVKNMMRDEGYIGIEQGIQQNIPALIDKELWDKCQEIKKKNVKGDVARTKVITIASKVLKCIQCGGNYGKKKTMYICAHNSDIDSFGKDAVRCWNCACNMSVIDMCLINSAKVFHEKYCLELSKSTKEEYEEKIAVLQQKIAASDKELVKLANKRERLGEMYLDGEINKEKYHSKKNEIKAQVENVQQMMKEYNDTIFQYQQIIGDINGNGMDEFLKYLNIKYDIRTMDDIKELAEIVKKYIKYAYVHVCKIGEKKFKLITVVSFNNKIDYYLYDYGFNHRCAASYVVKVNKDKIERIIVEENLTKALQNVMDNNKEELDDYLNRMSLFISLTDAGADRKKCIEELELNILNK